MKRILVATDGSDGGDRAVDAAVELTGATGAALTIVAGTIPFLSFYAERNATRKTRAGVRV